MTIYISIKTGNIDNKIHKLKDGMAYNKHRQSMISTLSTYQNDILDIKTNSEYQKLRTNILNDINKIHTISKLALNWKEKHTFNRLRKELEKAENYNKTTICNLLSKAIGFLSKKKEDL